MIRSKISKKEAEKNPDLLWNGFIDVVSLSEYKDLMEAQRKAHLAFWYDHEIQNGGHYQFFENRGLKQAEKTLIVLEEIGFTEQSKILKKAIAVYKKTNPNEDKVETVEEFIEEALEGVFDEIDSEYYACDPDMNELLEEYLKEHVYEFIEFI
ncbi:MAG TPA: DUF4375 domain-containing protein [Candidatus Nitrosocosmicus sp.]|nr:DUF4375 domain-containing protein [Candidatus Nitrosocosmicus sp.]